MEIVRVDSFLSPASARIAHEKVGSEGKIGTLHFQTLEICGNTRQ